MFTGIIETTGKVCKIEQQGKNVCFIIQSLISNHLKIDQSVSHNGVCLTIVEIDKDKHTVIAVDETLKKTNLISLQINAIINLERCITSNGRIDGHFVQGHSDTIATCISIENLQGSYNCTFEFPEEFKFLIVEKGSVCVNGISLTPFNVLVNRFTVAIIPYTFEHTNMKFLLVDSKVNIEFDILGKYMYRFFSLANEKFNIK